MVILQLKYQRHSPAVAEPRRKRRRVNARELRESVSSKLRAGEPSTVVINHKGTE